ncbi:hypothetical protein CRG98_021827 [Punica granatum]|uniref:Uncharacterized protein n=1 Tax=Punica granatum TaxID=22663 RepID=A0A2I0JPF5_PUNGR|nr:hypothetical protein CRG98_021827 [Punica granatum]
MESGAAMFFPPPISTRKSTTPTITREVVPQGGADLVLVGLLDWHCGRGHSPLRLEPYNGDHRPAGPTWVTRRATGWAPTGRASSLGMHVIVKGSRWK